MIMYPKGDGLKLGINIELPQATTLDTSQRVSDSVGRLLLEHQELESIVKLVGKKSPFAVVGLGDALRPTVGENFIGFSAIYLPRAERDAPGYVYADQLRRELNELLNESVAGASVVLVPETGQPSNEAPVQIELVGDDMDRLREISTQVKNAVRAAEGTVDVRDNIGTVASKINLVPRREAIDFYGLSLADIATQVRYAMGVGEIGKFDISGLDDDLPINLSMSWPSREGAVGGPTRMDELALVRVDTPSNGTVPLQALLSPTITMSPTSITHEDGKRSLSVLAKTDNRPPTEIIKELQPKLDEMQRDWPAGYSYRVAGEAQETAETFQSAGIMLILAVVNNMNQTCIKISSPRGPQ